jgi:hypothetical protein
MLSTVFREGIPEVRGGLISYNNFTGMILNFTDFEHEKTVEEL